MSDWLASLSGGWLWLSLGIVLVAVESLGATGFLLGAAAAAILLGLFVFFVPALAWQWQVTGFALLTGILTLSYFRYCRRFNTATDKPQLNRRMQQLIGSEHVLQGPIDHGGGRLQIGDTLWRVRSAERLDTGTRVRIVAVADMQLDVEKIT